MSDIVNYNGKDWCLLSLTNKHLMEPPLIERGGSPACYPSSASCWIQESNSKYLEGGCNRNAYYRMIGSPKTNPSGEYSYYINAHGKFIEEFLIARWKEMGIWVANNIKFYMGADNPSGYGFSLSGEIDCLIRKPGTKGLDGVYVAEVKSYYKWFKRKELVGSKDAPGKPSYNNLFQLMLYLDYFKEHGINNGKLLYTSRDEATQVEFDVSLRKINGYTHAVVNGVPDLTFSFEGVIERFRESWVAFVDRKIPDRDFKLMYDVRDMEDMFSKGLISKSRYAEYQKGKKCGDWQCGFCEYRDLCWGIKKKDFPLENFIID